MVRYAMKSTSDDLKMAILKDAAKFIADLKDYNCKDIFEKLNSGIQLADDDIQFTMSMAYENILEIVPYYNLYKSVFRSGNIELPMESYTNNHYHIEWYWRDEKFYQLGEYAIALCSAAEDDGYIVSFILYVDNDGKVRAYIPSEGNMFNKYTNTAYKEEYYYDGDKQEVWEKMPDEWKADTNIPFTFSEAYYDMVEDLFDSLNDFSDIEPMLEDIKENIVVK